MLSQSEKSLNGKWKEKTFLEISIKTLILSFFRILKKILTSAETLWELSLRWKETKIKKLLLKFFKKDKEKVQKVFFFHVKKIFYENPLIFSIVRVQVPLSPKFYEVRYLFFYVLGKFSLRNNWSFQTLFFWNLKLNKKDFWNELNKKMKNNVKKNFFSHKEIKQFLNL